MADFDLLRYAPIKVARWTRDNGLRREAGRSSGQASSWPPPHWAAAIYAAYTGCTATPQSLHHRYGVAVHSVWSWLSMTCDPSHFGYSAMCASMPRFSESVASR